MTPSTITASLVMLEVGTTLFWILFVFSAYSSHSVEVKLRSLMLTNFDTNKEDIREMSCLLMEVKGAPWIL